MQYQFIFFLSLVSSFLSIFLIILLCFTYLFYIFISFIVYCKNYTSCQCFLIFQQHHYKLSHLSFFLQIVISNKSISFTCIGFISIVIATKTQKGGSFSFLFFVFCFLQFLFLVFLLS